MTFSILARDPATGQVGVASQSHYLGVGSVVTWAEAGAGAVATQAFADRSYGPRGLALMRSGSSADQALRRLLDEDVDRDIRQVAFLDASGSFGIHTGTRCVAAAGVARDGDAVAIGNMLDNDQVPPALLLGYQQASGALAHRLVAGLRSADQAGGDIRGRQSAALLVVDGRPTRNWWEGVVRDLRVEDHLDPIGELSRLVHLNEAFDTMSQVVFDPTGAVLGEPRSDSDPGFAAAAHALADADSALNGNPEATFWSAVLHARSGRSRDARDLLQRAASHNARLPRFLDHLADAGILTREDIADVNNINQPDR